MRNGVCIYSSWATVLLLLGRDASADSFDNAKDLFRFGVAAMFSPKETISTYRLILYYLVEKLEMEVQMAQRQRHSVIEELFEIKNASFAMNCRDRCVKEGLDNLDKNKTL